MTTTTVKRIVPSFAICPVGILTGKVGGDPCDGDSLRSSLLTDGRVENIFNGFSHPLPDSCKARILSQPQGIRDLVASLISSTRLSDETLRLTAVTHQLDGRDINEVGTNLALNGVDASVLDNTSVALNAGNCLQTLRITYDGNVEAALKAGVGGLRIDAKGILTRAEMKDAPASITLAVDKLIAAGFCTAGANFDGASMRTITLTRGDGANLIRAEVTWIV
ncbi:hypothetical protein BH10CYA1_BH10CYA1_41590 [soil metagenome]